jgi:hypothetical protein
VTEISLTSTVRGEDFGQCGVLRESKGKLLDSFQLDIQPNSLFSIVFYFRASVFPFII